MTSADQLRQPERPKVGARGLASTPRQLVALALMVGGPKPTECGHGPADFAVGWRRGERLCALCFADEARARPPSAVGHCDMCQDRRDDTIPVHVNVSAMPDAPPPTAPLTLVCDLCPDCWETVADEKLIPGFPLPYIRQPNPVHRSHNRRNQR